ncbi:hypothetical protein Goklo_002267, partial [Gossypium klotzschianum]|nr:hypothetical protein [Gossypium klotzschianum]
MISIAVGKIIHKRTALDNNCLSGMKSDLLITWERTSPDMQIVMEHMFIYTMMLYGVSLCFTARSCSALCIWSSFCDETISISYD